jgi:MFS family permease
MPHCAWHGRGRGHASSLNACYEWLQDNDRNLPTALILFGATLGLLVAAPALSYLIVRSGWRAAFIACGVAGFAMLVLWLCFGKDGPGHAVNVAGAPMAKHSAVMIAQRNIWTDRTVIGNFLVGFAAYWVVGFTVAWLAPFVRSALGLGTMASGWLPSLVYLAFASFTPRS